MRNTLLDAKLAYISTRNAREVARRLKSAGYVTTAQECREYGANVAQRIGGMDLSAQREVLTIIDEVVIQPNRGS